MTMTKVRAFQCRHEEGCSQPMTFWQMKNYAVMYDQLGQVKERVMPDDTPQAGEVFSCTECGQEAWLKWQDERDMVKKEPTKQEVLL